MVNHAFKLSLSAAAIAVLVSACDAPPPGATRAPDTGNPDCIPVADGSYVIEGGRIVATAAPGSGAGTSPGLGSAIAQGFAGLGFPWMGLTIRDRVATLTGTAPDPDTKEAALLAGEQAIRANPEAAAANLLVVDGISVEGGERGVGTSLAALSASTPTAISCQTAFDETMQGRFVLFETNAADISPVSARLLDAVTGVAILCRDYVTEIGGHTDSRGADAQNLALSQARAEAVRDYLISKGVNPGSLRAIGYGETRPIDQGFTEEALARNRRTEFKVLER